MKRFLLLSAMLAIAGFSIQLNAQCSQLNLNVVIKAVTSTPGGCQVTLDVNFTGNFNSGNKYAFIHLWESEPVNNYPDLPYGIPPNAAQLASSVATIVIEEPGKNSAALHNQYVPDAGIPVLFSGIGFVKSGSTYSLTNVVLNLSTCSQAVTIKGDMWSSQSDDAQVVHCFSKENITLLLNNPVITGNKQCATPRLLNLNFANGHATLNESVVTEVFIDMNSDGLVDGGDVNITGSLSPALPNPMSLTANSSQSFTGMSYLPYSNQGIYDSKPIIVRAIATAPGAASVTNTKNNINFPGTCSLLPVTFSTFTAIRSYSTVELKWKTVSEQNNLGFAIERNISGTWQQLAFVDSKAMGGNSSNTLSYQYYDPNTTKAVTQYRIRQVDLDGRPNYSETRSVRGEGLIGKTIVYPNPSIDGTVKVVFEEAEGVRDVSLVDMSGRILKQWNGVTNNNIEISNLVPGMYSLRVIVRTTGEQVVNKIIVNAY